MQSIRRRSVTLITMLLVIVILPRIAVAQTNFAIAHVDNGNGQKFIYIHRIAATACRKVIDTFFSSMRVDCPYCTLDATNCVAKLDLRLNPVWANQPSFAPYFSSDNMRIIFTGRGRDELMRQCQALVETYRRASGKAQCIN